MLADQDFADILQVLYPPEDDRGLELVAAFWPDVVDIFQLFEGLRGNSKGVHPVVAAVGYKGEETEVIRFVVPTFVIGEGWLCNWQFVFVGAVGSEEEGHRSEEQTEETSHIGKDGVYFPDGPGDSEPLGRSIDVEIDVAGSWEGNRICSVVLYVIPCHSVEVLNWKETGVGLEGVLGQVEQPHCPHCVRKGQENTFLQDIGYCIIFIRSDDGVKGKELDLEVVIGGNVRGDVAVNVGSCVAGGVQSLVAGVDLQT